MICFTCGKQGHKEDNCSLNATTADMGDNVEQPAQTNPNTSKQPTEQALYGSWMMVRKPRRKSNKQGPIAARTNNTTFGGEHQNMAMQGNRGRLLQMESDGTHSMELEHRMADAGSRFRGLAEDAQEENNQEVMEQT